MTFTVTVSDEGFRKKKESFGLFFNFNVVNRFSKTEMGKPFGRASTRIFERISIFILSRAGIYRRCNLLIFLNFPKNRLSKQKGVAGVCLCN